MLLTPTPISRSVLIHFFQPMDSQFLFWKLRTFDCRRIPEKKTSAGKDLFYTLLSNNMSNRLMQHFNGIFKRTWFWKSSGSTKSCSLLQINNFKVRLHWALEMALASADNARNGYNGYPTHSLAMSYPFLSYVRQDVFASLTLTPSLRGQCKRKLSEWNLWGLTWNWPGNSVNFDEALIFDRLLFTVQDRN